MRKPQVGVPINFPDYVRHFFTCKYLTMVVKQEENQPN